MIRETSIISYNTIRDSGLLSKRRWEVYDVLYHHGPATGAELAMFYRKKYGASSPSNPNTLTRLGELRDMGVVTELGSRICSVTGQTVINWDVTSKLPKALATKTKVKCESCNGKGYHLVEDQQELF